MFIGEKMLKEEVQQLLIDWAGYLQTATKIFISAPKLMQSVLFDFSGSSLPRTQAPPLVKDDPRICHVPFMVDKITYEETKSIVEKCSTVLFRIRLVSPPPVITSESQAGAEETEDEAYAQLIESDLLYYETNKHTLTSGSNSGTLESIPENGKPKVPTTEELPVSKVSQKLFALILAGDAGQVKQLLQYMATLSNVGASDLLIDIKDKTNESTIDGADEADKDDDDVDADDEEPPVQQSPPVLGEQSATITTPIPQTLPYIPSSIEPWEDLDTIVNYPQSLETLSTPLHLASELGHTLIIRYLLIYHANPLKLDIRNRTAYHISKDKQTRDTFRRIRGNNELRWSWECSGVGEGITYESIKLQKMKEKEKKKRLKNKKKDEKIKIETTKLLQFQLQQEKEKENLIKLSIPCDMCGKVTFGIQNVLLFLDKKCCSSACSLQLRRQLQADAALSRMNNSKK